MLIIRPFILRLGLPPLIYFMIDPLNVVYGNTEISDRYNSFEQFQNNIYEIYNLARENMNTRQKVSPTYNKKARDDNLDIDDKVFVYLPRNERAKLKCKWMGPYKIVEAHHLT